MSNATNLKTLFPRGSKDFYEANDLCEIPHPVPEPHKTSALERTDAGKKPGIRRVRVRFTGYRVRCLDPDNFAGSCKDLLDGLRHAGILLGDEPWRIIFETAQEKVGTFKEERTVIEVTL